MLSSVVQSGTKSKKKAANQLKNLFSSDLPPLIEQKNKSYRPSIDEINHIYDLLNEAIFNQRLTRPPICVIKFRGNWGWCIPQNKLTASRSWSEILLVDRWFCVQWLIIILAHEMAHQYEWDILGRKLSHGKHFFRWKKKLSKYHIPLKRQYCGKAWLVKQKWTAI